MAATSFLLLVLVPALLFALFWRFDRNVADGDSPDNAADPSEGEVFLTEVAAAERLRREAAATADEKEKASLNRLADEAEADAQKLKRDLE